MSGPNDIAVINARRNELLSNPHAGQKPTARYSSVPAGSSNVTVPTDALGGLVANLMNRGKAPIMANGAQADFDNSKDVVDAIKSGKLKKIESIRFAEQFGLVQADKLDDLTPGAAMALLEQDANEDPTLVNEVVTSQVVKPHDTYVKNGDQVGFEEQPKPQGKINEDSLMRHKVPSDSTVNQAKTEENAPTPKGEIHPEKMKPQMGSGSGGYESTVNKSKEQDGKTSPEKVNIMKAEKLVNATPVKYDDSYVKNGDPLNTEEMKKPDHVSNDYIDNTPPVGETNPSKASDVNKAKPQDTMTMPENSKINPKGMPSVGQIKPDGIMDMMGGDAGGPPMPPPEMGGEGPKDDMIKDEMPKGEHGHGGHDHKPHMAPMKKVEEALELLTELTRIMETMENPIKQKAPKKNKSEGGDKPKEDGASKDEKPKDSGAEDNKFHDKHDKKDDKKDEPKEPKKDDKPKDAGPSLPGILGYKVEFVNDVKSPTESYYVVSLKQKPLFSVSAAQAQVKLEATNDDLTLDQFKSTEYADLLTTELNKQGAKEVFNTVFASRGIIAADGPMAPGATPPPAAGGESQALPEDKFGGPAKDMIPSPAVDSQISQNAPSKHSHIDLILEIAADALANTEGSTPEEFVDQLGEIFSDESKKRQFLGRLTEKVEHKKKDMNITNETPAGMQDMKAENDTLKAAINKLHPKVVALAKDYAELKEKDIQNQKNAILKARASKTVEVAQKKAQLGLIADSDVQNETIRLAKLSNEELGKEVQELQNSIKIANKINQTTDCNIVEPKNVNAVKKPINAVQAVPSQLESEEFSKESNSKFPWSKGVFQGY